MEKKDNENNIQQQFIRSFWYRFSCLCVWIKLTASFHSASCAALNGPCTLPSVSLYSKEDSSSLTHPLCKYCSMAAKLLHTSRKTECLGALAGSGMLNPGGLEDITQASLWIMKMYAVVGCQKCGTLLQNYDNCCLCARVYRFWSWTMAMVVNTTQRGQRFFT